MVSLEQIRAYNAFQAAQQVGANKDFLAFARNLPSLFQNNGLLATWAFMLAKAKKENYTINIMNTLLEHFRTPQIGLVPNDQKTAEEVFNAVWTQASFQSQQLMNLTAEAIAFSGWIKRAAEALCDTEGGQG
ncbi:type III-B CRISPR module-associated protein Cmr5 [bacterium]|nr:type III-B CRISPR module-associated protein Cmr5 [bacterium]